MAWAERLPSGRYRGMYRDALGRRRSAGTFSHKPRATRSAAAAEEKARRTLAESADGRMPWGVWCDEWWQVREVETSTLLVDENRRRTHLDPRWGSIPIGAITRHDVKSWAADLRRAGVGPSTVQRAVHLLSASLSAAIDRGLLDVNPAARIRLPGSPPAEERFLTRAEYDLIRSELATTREQLVVDMLTFTGLRWGELAGLHWDRVDLVRGQLRVVETYVERAGVIKLYPKGRRLRTVPIPAALVVQLAGLERATSCGQPHERGGRCRSGLVLTTDLGHVLRNSNFRKQAWQAALEHAGMSGVRIHDLRHTYASWLLQAGRPLAEVGQLLGHISTQTTQRYSHLAAEQGFGEVLAALAAPRLPHADEA